ASGGDGGTGGDPGGEVDAAAPDSAVTPSDGPRGGAGGAIDVSGAIPPYEGPPVGPEVKMDCPGDPTAGFMEYKDTFHVEHPYDLPVSERFSIDGGIYTFWVVK